MKTTSLVAELLVIGVSTSMAIVLALGSVAPTGLVYLQALPVAAIGVAFAFCYLLGILTDRAADAIFACYFHDDVRGDLEHSHYLFLRGKMFQENEQLAEIFEYTRSRLRVCRGWTLGSLFLAAAWAAFVMLRVDQPMALAIGGSVSFTVLSIACYYAWKALYRSEIDRIKAYGRTLEANGFMSAGNESS